MTIPISDCTEASELEMLQTRYGEMTRNLTIEQLAALDADNLDVIEKSVTMKAAHEVLVQIREHESTAGSKSAGTFHYQV